MARTRSDNQGFLMAIKNKYYIDFFSGCGGLSLGLGYAGWNGLFAIEKDPMAYATFQHNLIDKSALISIFKIGLTGYQKNLMRLKTSWMIQKSVHNFKTFVEKLLWLPEALRAKVFLLLEQGTEMILEISSYLSRSKPFG